jgi:uncharacterized protein YebE (UPF0316 family)
MVWNLILGGLVIFALRVLSVTIGTVRTLLTVRGLKLASAAMGFVEVLIFVLAISQVITDIGNIWNVLGYCGGFAVGTIVGMALEDKLALGFAVVRIMSTTRWPEIIQALRGGGYGATKVIGEGKDGPLGIVYTVVRRKEVRDVVQMCEQLDQQAFITVEDAGRVYRGFLPAR